jgi:hypothetical protein
MLHKYSTDTCAVHTVQEDSETGLGLETKILIVEPRHKSGLSTAINVD